MNSLAASHNIAGTLVARLDPVGRLIRIVGSGSWSIELLERHIEELQRLLLKAREAERGVRVLSDLRLSAVQTPNVASRIEQFTAEGYESADRIAVVVSSSLLKMQMRRVVQSARIAVFLSIDAAEAWLMAHGQAISPSLSTVERAPRRLTSIISTARTTDGLVLAVRVIDISTSGVLIEGRAALCVGTRLELTLPSTGVVTGSIVRVRNALAGVKLDRPLDAAQLDVMS